MTRIILVIVMFVGLIAVSTTDADAFVCARGLYRAGCVGPNGAIGIRRGFVGGVGYRGVGAVGYRAVGVRRWGYARY